VWNTSQTSNQPKQPDQSHAYHTVSAAYAKQTTQTVSGGTSHYGAAESGGLEHRSGMQDDKDAQYARTRDSDSTDYHDSRVKATEHPAIKQEFVERESGALEDRDAGVKHRRVKKDSQSGTGAEHNPPNVEHYKAGSSEFKSEFDSAAMLASQEFCGTPDTHTYPDSLDLKDMEKSHRAQQHKRHADMNESEGPSPVVPREQATGAHKQGIGKHASNRQPEQQQQQQQQQQQARGGEDKRMKDYSEGLRDVLDNETPKRGKQASQRKDDDSFDQRQDQNQYSTLDEGLRSTVSDYEMPASKSSSSSQQDKSKRRDASKQEASKGPIQLEKDKAWRPEDTFTG